MGVQLRKIGQENNDGSLRARLSRAYFLQEVAEDMKYV